MSSSGSTEKTADNGCEQRPTDDFGLVEPRADALTGTSEVAICWCCSFLRRCGARRSRVGRCAPELRAENNMWLTFRRADCAMWGPVRPVEHLDRQGLGAMCTRATTMRKVNADAHPLMCELHKPDRSAPRQPERIKSCFVHASVRFAA